jgi:UDP-N-acetylglucosamine 2-epimerase (non-hydrolysing)
MRDTTERPEAVEAGTVILVGVNRKKIVKECNDLLKNNYKYQQMSELRNPYGDGIACQRISEHIISLNKYHE